jgi:hypothetical protein
MIDWYVFFLTLFLVKLVMLMNMQATGGVPALVECPMFPTQLEKVLVNPKLYGK